MNNLNKTLRESLSFLDNEYVSTGVALFLVLYAGLAAPALPETVARLFENTLFKLLVFFLIAYTSRKNPTVAIIASIGLLVSLQTLNRYNTERKMMEMVAAEEAAAAEFAVSESAGIHASGGNPEINSQAAPQLEGPMNPESLEELQAEIPESDDGSEVDSRNNFYPGYVDTGNFHLARRFGQPVTGMEEDNNMAPV